MARVVDPRTGKSVLVYVNGHNYQQIAGATSPMAGYRKDLSLFYSLDEGASWKFGRLLHGTGGAPAGYSSLQPYGTNGDVVLLYETDMTGQYDYSKQSVGLRFMRFNPVKMFLH